MNSYLHVDLDAFFASVEQLDNPELRGKPVIVGGRPEDRRSVVSTASYEARAFGVHSAMPVFQAYRLCPQGIFVHGRMHRYAELSHQIMNIFRDYSPDVDQMSIDEAFIDLTGTEKLFGSPEETARKIKARVKEETGLTVSVGLASTKYLAKIASGLSKPDGFYIIKPGTEESFMLKLPLNKVWGLGPKSLELIRSKGLTSTRDIYERDYESLEFLFGKNMAGFLYNVVRGIEKESFSRETKSHSISAETTFPYDLTDIYTIETELLELAQGVFFRLLKEESFSRTAFVKIRYDDFSTGTVQETVDRNIITLDSYYEIIKRLFEKRYQNGRGIRLLGVGFENIVKEEKPYQQDLFDTNNDKKKQAVEKAILKLSKKHPEIKVSKARTLKAILFALLIGALPAKANAEEEPVQLPPPEDEGPVYLFDYDIDDKNHVDFSASGLWKIEFTTGLDITFGNGTKTASSPAIPIFKQETDISTLLTLNKKWYFEAAFADEFTRNTFAFGYRSQELVRHFRLANRGITMSEGYSAEHFGYAVRGGNNQAPGMLLELSSPSEKVRSDFLVRYDMTETKSQIYYGMNKVSDIKISAEDFAYGREFRFPEKAAQALLDIKEVYIESSAGTYKDSGGRLYRKLRKDEYALAGSPEKRLYISQEAGGGKTADGDIPSILITFAGSGQAASILFAAGSWDDSTGFFGKIQEELGANGTYKVEDYCGNLLAQLEGEAALVIQSSSGFSPFLCPYLYDFGSKKDADFLVISDKSEIPVNKYKVIETEEIYTRLYENFFDTNNLSVRVLDKEAGDSLYPFARDCPEIYFEKAQKTNLCIRGRTYTPVKEIIISKKASAGTVQVYRNGNLMSGIIFDENTGVVNLNSPVSETDQLLITWQEEASDFTQGAVTAASGIKVNFLPQLTGDLSLTTRQPVTKEGTLVEKGSQKNSFTALSGGITWSDYGFTLKEKAAVSLLNDNTAQGLVLYSWSEIWEDYLDEKKNSTEAERKKLTEPVKASSISFEKQDFSSYKKINIEIEFFNSDEESALPFTGPLTITLDEDTGTALKGKEALLLYISDIEKYAASGGKHTVTVCLEKDGKADEYEVLFDEHSLSKKSYTLKVKKNIIPSRLSLEAQNTADNHKVLVRELSYAEAKYYGTFRNYTAAEYKKDGELVSLKDFALLKDFYASAESDQGSGSFSQPEPFVSLKTQGGITASGLKLSGDLSMQDLTQSAEIEEAGHSVKTDNSLLVFRLFSAEDTYRYRPSTGELQKHNAFALDTGALPLPVKIPFKASLSTSADKSLLHEKQNAEITAGYTQKIYEGEAGLNARLKLSQKLDKSSPQAELEENYAQGWTSVSRLAFSDGKENAQNRTSLWGADLKGSVPFAAGELTMTPKLTYELSDSYQRTQTDDSDNPLFSDKEFLSLLLPFTAKTNSFSFEIARTGGGNNQIKKGGSYASDSHRLFELQNQRDWFYSSIPFYELFDYKLKEKVSPGSGYAAKYEGNFRRSLFNSTKDIIVPSALTLALTREVTRQLPESDLYQIKAVITNNSLNNFGSKSSLKYFDWFQQEELTTTLTTIFKIPAAEPDNLKINIQAYAQLLLFISDKSILTEQFDFSIENHANWNLRDTLAYSRPSKTSLMTFFANLLIPSSDNSDYAITRKDSISAELGKNDAQLQQKYSYSHTVGVDFLEYYNVNAALGGTLILNEKKADSVNLTLTLGAKAEF